MVLPAHAYRFAPPRRGFIVAAPSGVFGEAAAPVNGAPAAPTAPTVAPTAAYPAPLPPCGKGKRRNKRGKCVPKKQTPVWVIPSLVGGAVLILGLGVLALTGGKGRAAAPAGGFGAGGFGVGGPW